VGGSGAEEEERLRIVVGVTGASGSIYGWRLLEILKTLPKIEVHLILTRAGERTAWLETGRKAAEFRELASHSHAVDDIGAPVASGSYLLDAMVVAPCSIHSMSAIATGVTSNLLLRTADVMLKERRKLVLMVRETPLHLGHLRTMASLVEMGAIIAPPIPAFYHKPGTIADLVDHSVHRVLDLIGLPSPEARRWGSA